MKTIQNISLLCILLIGLLPLTFGINYFVVANEKNSLFDETLYSKTYEALSNYEPSFTVEFNGKTSDIRRQLTYIINAIKKDDIYLYENISKWSAKYSYRGSSGKVVFTITYLTNKEQEKFVTSEIKRLSKTIITEEMTDFEKIKAVHDYAVLNAEYSSETNASQYTTYAMLTEQKAVCQGYAFFMYRMLQELGIEVKYVKGRANNTLHGWNLVKLNDKWYHLDSTWDEPLTNNKNQVRYKYFLVSDKKMAQSHTWINSDYPTATSEKYVAMHIVDQAYTIGNHIYYRNLTNKALYVMDVETLRSSKVSSAFYETQILKTNGYQ